MRITEINMSRFKKYIFVGLCSVSICSTAVGQQQLVDTAGHFSPANLQKQVGTMQVIPFFIKGTGKFWMVDNPPELGNQSVSNYYLVDPARKTKQPLFDKAGIEKSLRSILGQSIEASKIQYQTNFSADGRTVEIGYHDQSYDYNYLTKKLNKRVNTKLETPVYHIGDISPDKQWLLYARHHNLYLKRIADSTEKALTSDAAENFSFSINGTDNFAATNSPTDAYWLPDSRHFYVLRKDNRKVETMTVTNSLMSPRPYVNTYVYELPGDKEVVQYDFFIGDVAEQRMRKIDIHLWPDQEVSVVKASGLKDEIFLLRRKRTRDELDLCAVNLHTGKVRSIIREVSKPFINEDLFNVSILQSGKNIIWWSDRSGWGHYYLYNGDGQLQHAITKGDWTAGKILATDTLKQELYFYGYGKEKDRNPYFSFLYKSDLAGKKQVLLSPENATHEVFMSPDLRYFVDNYSRIDLKLKAVVRDNEGKMMLEVLNPDLTKLYAYGWKPAEPFTIKAKDGVTDLYGLMWKPFNFDPNKKYPVISQVYPGPFTETVWTSFTLIDRYNNTELAQDGFVVVVMGHRGGSPYRNAAYYKYGYGNIRDYALEDDKYGLEQLGKRYAFMDMDRIGIYGHSGGGMMAVAALGTYPDFYKVAVSSSGNHDNTIYNRTWGESYQGFEKPYDLNQDLATKIKGPLLLVAGESDENVNPAATMRMVNALILANKDFELLMLPGQHHTYQEPYQTYFQRRLRKYFVRYLSK